MTATARPDGQLGEDADTPKASTRYGRPPQWAKEAENVSLDRVTDEMHPIGDVAVRTGLSETAIWAAVRSSGHGGQRAALRTIHRPRWAIEGIEPRWDDAQILTYLRVAEAMQSVSVQWAHLPVVTRQEAINAQLASLSGIWQTAGIPKTTLNRWKLWEQFPLPIARMDSGGPSPKILYVWRRTSRLESALAEAISRFSAEDIRTYIDDPARWNGPPQEWLAAMLRQYSVAEWVREKNPAWLLIRGIVTPEQRAEWESLPVTRP
jgi:hypothetical protein